MKNEPAFPNCIDNGVTVKYHTGMTLRDYFAAQALPRVIDYWMKPVPDTFDLPEVSDAIAKEAYLMADAMLKARET